MEVTFYYNSKKINSTALPVQGYTKNCVLKDTSSIMNPYIEIRDRLDTAPPWNYCHIETFNRYYWVSEWTWEQGYWSAYLQVDVLTTYRDSIFNSTLYVTRSASNWDGNIIDNMYPTKIDNELIRVPLEQPWSVDVIPTNGTFIIGVTAPSGGYFGSINYFAMSQSGYAKLCAYLGKRAVSEDNGFSWDDCSESLQKALTDPFQYIKSCKWVALEYNSTNFSGVVRSSLPIYMWDVDVGSCTQLVKSYGSVSFNFSVRNHPQTGSRGQYMNYSPYTQINMFLPPFGTFPLDTTYTGIYRSGFKCTMLVDYITGGGAYYVQVLDPESKECGIIANGYGQVAIDIQLSQVTTNGTGIVSSGLGSLIGGAVGGFLGGVSNMLADNPNAVSEGVTSGASYTSANLGSAIQSKFSKVSTNGTQGGFSSYAHVPYIDYQFFTAVDDDVTENGRPLMQNVRIGNLSGYCQVQNGDINMSGTAQEHAQVQAFLQGGFYIE